MNLELGDSLAHAKRLQALMLEPERLFSGKTLEPFKQVGIGLSHSLVPLHDTRIAMAGRTETVPIEILRVLDAAEDVEQALVVFAEAVSTFSDVEQLSVPRPASLTRLLQSASANFQRHLARFVERAQELPNT